MADQEDPKPDEISTETAQENATPVPETQVKEADDTPVVTTENTTAESTEEQTKPDEEQKPAEDQAAPPAEVQETAVDEESAEQTEQKEVEVKVEDKPAEEEQKPEGEETKPEGEQTEGEGAEGAAVQEDEEDKPKGEGDEDKPVEQGEAAAAAEGEEVKPSEGEEKTEGEGEPVAEGEEKKEEEGEKPQEVSKSPVPQSDTFAEGERAESPVGVGERLSREGSPVQTTQIPVPDILEPGTPERSRPGSPEEGTQLATFEEEEEEEEEPEFDREELIEKYHQAISEREQLQQQNYTLQNKLAEYFKKKKADESRQDYDKNVTDQEQRYLKYMAQLEDLRGQDMQERESYKHQIQELKTRCEDKKERVDEERQRFMEYKKQVALNALNSRSGRSIPPKDIEVYLNAENKKEADVVNVRLENIKLKNKLKKKEQQLKSKEELAEGLHLIDFEQLKIENQTYNEKIEERNEELLKLRKKITSTVQVLTHLKEKLQYVQAENQIQKRNLREVEAEVAQKRDILSRTKQARDALRIDNQRLRQSCGLLGNEPLLRDFEERKDEGDDLREKLEHLKMQHAELTLHCNQVRRKIEQARNGRA